MLNRIIHLVGELEVWDRDVSIAVRKRRLKNRRRGISSFFGVRVTRARREIGIQQAMVKLYRRKRIDGNRTLLNDYGNGFVTFCSCSALLDIIKCR